MKNYSLIVPVTGSVQLNITAKDAEEALDILIKKQPELESLPYGHLEMELSKIIVMETNIGEYN